MRTPSSDVEPLLAGTLALMSAFLGGTRCPHMGRKIASNLARIAAHPMLSPEFRTIVGRLAGQWAQRDGEAVSACAEPMAGLASALLH